MAMRSSRTNRLSSAIILCGLLLLPAEARPQDGQQPALPITLGGRVRLLAPTVIDRRVEGMVLEVDARSVVIATSHGAPVKVPRAAITRLELVTGRRRQTVKGMIIGAGIGLALGALTGSTYNARTADEWALVLGYGGAGGALWGAGIGALFQGDEWSVIPLQGTLVGVASRETRGARVSFSVRF
jgi:hypothetical protein